MNKSKFTIMHENRKLWMEQSEIQRPLFNKKVFYFRHARKSKIFGTQEMLCISQCPENPTTLDAAKRSSEFARPSGSGRIFMIFCLLLIIIISGCKSKTTGREISTITGTDGIIINFLKGNPQDNYLISEDDEPISVILEVRNKGSYPQEDDINRLSSGKIYLSGYDTNIIELENIPATLNRQALGGASSINPEGGFDLVEFEGSIYPSNIIVNKYEPTILATVCYPYETKASPSVCIDPFPFDDKQKKVCEIGSQTLTSQGAPIAITSIDQEASSSKIQFKISLKNAGNGDIIRLSALDKCNPTGGDSLERDDLDRIELVRATAGFEELRCEPFAESGRVIRLYDGEGFIICSLDSAAYSDAKSAYTTPLNLEFRYGYRTTISKPIKISKITSVG